MLHILFNVYRFYAYITCQAKLDMHIHNHSLRRRAFQKSPTMWIWIRTCGCVRASVLLPHISNIDFEIEFDELFPGSVTNERFPQPFRATATFFFHQSSFFLVVSALASVYFVLVDLSFGPSMQILPRPVPSYSLYVATIPSHPNESSENWLFGNSHQISIEFAVIQSIWIRENLIFDVDNGNENIRNCWPVCRKKSRRRRRTDADSHDRFPKWRAYLAQL